MSNPYRHPISTPVPELQGKVSIASKSARSSAPGEVEREAIRKAVRDAWFDGRGSRGGQYDSEGVEETWDGFVNRALAALSPQGLDAKEGRCGKCRGSGHVQRGDSGECDACGGTGDDTSEPPSQRLDAATVERCDCIDLEALTYDELWGAIAAATRVEASIVAISVVKFREAIRALATEPHQHGGKA